MFNFFEHPWGLIVIAAAIFFIILVLQTIFPQKRLRWFKVISVLLIIAAFGIDYLVETDREKISKVITTAVKAVENEDPDSIETIIASDYRDSLHSSKTALMSYFRRALSEPLIRKNITRINSIDIQLPRATVIFTVRIFFEQQSSIYQGFKQQLLVESQADLEKQPDGRWLTSQIELLKIDLQPANWQNAGSASW